MTVIDAFTLFHDFDTDDMLSSRRDDVMPEDERTVSDLMVDQIEFADVIVLNKTDMVDADMLQWTLKLIKRLNHRAKILQTNYGKIDVREILNTGLFNLERAQTGYGWLQDLHAMTLRQVNGKNVVTPKPETEEYDVQNFVYTQRRPFHPRRLYTLLYDKFILQLEHPDDGDEEEDEEEDTTMSDASDETEDDDLDEEDDDEDEDEDEPINDAPPDNSVILANKRNDPLFRRLFRSKGEFFLATRPQQAGEWSQAGAMLTMTGGRPWFCTLTEEDYLTGDAEVDRLVKHDLASGGEWGDRRQEIVFIGESLDTKALEQALDSCVLNDEEYTQWEVIMRGKSGKKGSKSKGKKSKVPDPAKVQQQLQDLFEDGFPDWPLPDEVLTMDHSGHNHA